MITTTEKRPSSAFTTIDFDRAGKQIGHIMFPHSPDDDAWGVTQVPIAVIANGKGPTVILEGGNHGDEYEGPIVIGELTRDLDPMEIQGRLILMPSNNVHAAMAARRTSPVDGLNYNRTFPGDPYGSITEQISAYVTDYIFPLGDAFLDLHSGGSSLDILPSAIIEPTLDKELAARNTAAARAFDTSWSTDIRICGKKRWTSMGTATPGSRSSTGPRWARASAGPWPPAPRPGTADHRRWRG